MPVVIVPWRDGCSHREAAWDWVAPHYDDLGWRPFRSMAPDGPWVKANAVRPVAEALPDEAVCVVADADAWCAGLPEAVDAVDRGAEWAIPHGGVFRLSREATAEVLAGAELHEGLETEERPYRGLRGGGMVAARAETLREVPIDPRFVGWGGEDLAWGIALAVLRGDPWRGKQPLFHLWHPPQPRMTRRSGSIASKRLVQRYSAAATDPDRMRDLLSEVM